MQIGTNIITLDDLKNLANLSNGHCLSDAYINARTKYKWQCKNGHIWEAFYYNIRKGTWCPVCSRVSQAHDIDFYKNLAKLKDGECLSLECKNQNDLLTWKCKFGHIWVSKAYNIHFNDTWCPACNGGIFNSKIEDLIDLIKSKDGTYISGELKSANDSIITLRCNKDNFQWETSFTRLKGGQWCPRCVNKVKYTIEDVKYLAALKGGRCLSDNLNNRKSKLLWECQCGYKWHSHLSNIIAGHWCHRCANRERPSFDKILKLVEYKDGEFISGNYENNGSKLIVKCNKHDYKWTTCWSYLNSGKWCPKCGRQLSVVEEHLYKILLNKYPDAKSKSRGLLANRRFELDIWIPSLRIGIEYNGFRWHYSEWAIKNGVPERDARKANECIDAGIKLIIIKEQDYINNPDLIIDNLLKELENVRNNSI